MYYKIKNPIMMEIGYRIKDMDLVKWYGKIQHNMKDNGKIIRQMEKESLLILIWIFMRGSGKITKHMVQEYFKVWRLDMKEVGK